MTILKVALTDTNIFFTLSDHSVHVRLLTAVPYTFLYQPQATATERDGWDIVDRGTAVEWAALGHKVTIEQILK